MLEFGVGGVLVCGGDELDEGLAVGLGDWVVVAVVESVMRESIQEGVV